MTYCGQAEKDGLVQPGEGKAEMGSCCCLQLHGGRVESRWSQALGAPCLALDLSLQETYCQTGASPVEATRPVRGLELRTCQENLREQDLLHLEKSRQRRGLIVDYNYITGAYKELGARLFKKVHGGGMRSNGSKLEHGNSS